MLVCVVALTTSAAWAAPFTVGDVFADVGGGIIKEFTPAGVLVQSLNTTHPGEGDGMAFDASGNLYATVGFAANTIVKFDSSGTLVNASFGSGYNSHPESIVVDNTNGVLYVGQADGSHNVLKFKLDGTFVQSFAPAVQNRGTDWVDLQSDLKTLRYTSEGNQVKAFDVSTGSQLANFSTALPATGTAYAHRILSDGGELVADSTGVIRLDSLGNVIRTYTIAGTSLLFALNLDPNGTDFWTADYFTGDVFEVNIATGAIDRSWNAGLVGEGPLGGLAVFGEICATCTSVPEPSTLILLGSALAGLAGFFARRRHSV
jgi:outer membrane protein assembly factor BamB